jgi:DNA-binding NarL/FixJ family response regulator
VPENRPLRILVVDDHAPVRQGLVTLLAGEADLQVVGEATDGEQAVEAARLLAPDVVLMDVNMPGMNGIDATRAIRGEWPAVRVIGLSAVETAVQAEAMRQAGAAVHLSKSVPAETLLAAIRGGGG